MLSMQICQCLNQIQTLNDDGLTESVLVRSERYYRKTMFLKKRLPTEINGIEYVSVMDAVLGTFVPALIPEILDFYSGIKKAMKDTYSKEEIRAINHELVYLLSISAARIRYSKGGLQTFNLEKLAVYDVPIEILLHNNC